MKPLSPKIRVEVEPYSKLAYIYDDIMSHVDYELWSKYILKIIDKFGKKVDSILDVSCGTANLLLCLKSKRYHLVGFDFSSDMIKVARAKLRSDSDVHLYQGDMTLFYLNKKFDVILCLYDSVNYLMDFNLWHTAHEAGAGVVALVSQDAIDFQRMADRLVDLQVDLIRVQQQIHRPGGAVGGREQSERLLGQLDFKPPRGEHPA